MPMNLHEMTQAPEGDRNQTWENNFFKALSEGNIHLLTEEPQTGPDGWPYLLAETSTDASEPAQKVLAWLSTRGIGLAINPTKEVPDYVFSYGMVWSFRETGYFYRQVATPEDGAVEFNPKDIIHAGTLSQEYLPDYARSILKEFFRDQGLLAVKVLLLSTDRLNYDLAISLESLKNPPEQEHAGIAEAIGWFLPPHYSILLVSEKGLPPFELL